MRGNTRIPDACLRWKDYRQQITDYIIESSESGERILILGSGACDDIDLYRMLELDMDIWLSDINVTAMEEAVAAVEKGRPDWVTRLHKVEADFILVTEADVQKYEEACCQNLDSLQQWWERYQSVREQNPMLGAVTAMMREAGIVQFDLVICIGLHSQLYMDLAWRTFELQNQMQKDAFQWTLQRIQEENAQMAERFMKEVQSIAKKMILGLEYTTFYKNQPELEQKALEQLMEYGSEGLSVLNLPRVEGAYQMERELGICCQNQEVDIQDWQYFYWPFSEEKSYLMVIFTIV